ncbi:hypothetical protein GCM10010840_00520 [Deinococcus aerolatus]|uniref:Uncharacterized protein n=1 Tax=Deinococcus aerolatus TaxID=522487 RepID=A0ABQ2FYJ0_9DEIO|nr:hypothetical protein [Deinococcus aerolatus]GGL66523.1 hypothetical protein GCM10010840_00520 [Deinococcus aerolatus]
MTESPTLPTPAAPPPVPLDRTVYAGLRTDHYPWTEIMADLETRQSEGFSGVLDAEQGERWARFVWVRGQCLGGFTGGGQAVGWELVHGGLPRARVSLGECSPPVGAVVWTSRAARAGALAGRWPDVQLGLKREQFYGLLVSEGLCSVWDSGQVLAGRLPDTGEMCVAYSPNTPENRERLLQFWRDLLGAVHASIPLDEVWQQTCMRLSAEHPCLDPFVREITLSGGVLFVDRVLAVGEFRPALQTALRAVLLNLGINLNDLALGDLPNRPEWAAAGLGGPVLGSASQRRQVGR